MQNQPTDWMPKMNHFLSKQLDQIRNSHDMLGFITNKVSYGWASGKFITSFKMNAARLLNAFMVLALIKSHIAFITRQWVI